MDADTPESSASTRDYIPDEVLAQVAEVLANAGKPDATTASIASTGWRIEVTRNGKYWQWRRGAGKARTSRYGGKFGSLAADRQAAYWQNRRTHSRTSARNPAASAPGIPAGRGNAGNA